MTTIAIRGSDLCADTCVTHGDDNGDPVSRTEMQKIVLRWAGNMRMFIASKGDADIGGEMDELLAKQFCDAYKLIKKHGFLYVMNLSTRLKARQKLLGSADYGALVTYFSRSGVTWEHSGSYEINGSGRVLWMDGGYAAIGCDKLAALGAMSAGASAEDAVRAACKHGAYSALPMHSVTFKDGHVNFRKLGA